MTIIRDYFGVGLDKPHMTHKMRRPRKEAARSDMVGASAEATSSSRRHNTLANCWERPDKTFANKAVALEALWGIAAVPCC